MNSLCEVYKQYLPNTQIEGSEGKRIIMLNSTQPYRDGKTYCYLFFENRFFSEIFNCPHTITVCKAEETDTRSISLRVSFIKEEDPDKIFKAIYQNNGHISVRPYDYTDFSYLFRRDPLAKNVLCRGVLDENNLPRKINTELTMRRLIDQFVKKNFDDPVLVSE